MHQRDQSFLNSLETIFCEKNNSHESDFSLVRVPSTNMK